MLVLGVGLVCPSLAQAANTTVQVKEVNFVYLHGMGSNAEAFQMLDDSIIAQMPPYITNYQATHTDIKIQTDGLLRSYPNQVDIETWAQNIASAVNKHFQNKKNLVLIGHSMGGKTALYAVAHNIGGLADRVAMVVTINSPIKNLNSYYYIGGDTALEYWGIQTFMADRKVLSSLVNYDSTEDGKWVAAHKHWLAFVSAEASPVSSQFDVSGVDPLPRNMDDIIVPVDCQYAESADVVYYGQYEHGDFAKVQAVSDYISDQILRYIYGGSVEYSVFARGGFFQHKSGLWPGTDYWQDVVGAVLAESGTVFHKNSSFFKWQDWQDTVGGISAGSSRSSYEIIQNNSSPFLTGLKRSAWANPDNLTDDRLLLSTHASPGSSVQIDWRVYQEGLLPSGITRDHYEVELNTGTQLATISQVNWATDNPQDLRLLISSQAQRPFRWFQANWRVYYKESRQRQVIDELPVDSVTP
jgi:pimeloyl-ACP methyl ester carboxylesterase